MLVGADARPVGLVGGEALERDQREGDVVGALVRHPVADEVAAAARDDLDPALGVGLERAAPEGIELVADENRDGHGARLHGESRTMPRCGAECFD